MGLLRHTVPPEAPEPQGATRGHADEKALLPNIPENRYFFTVLLRI